MYGKLWVLHFLKKSGMDEAGLLKVYETVLRPSAEYSSIIYGCLIPEYISNRLELIQKQAAKIIFGYNTVYEQLLEDGKIETLKQRRSEATPRFALKAAGSVRFGPQWFTETSNSNREVRPSTRQKYIERRSRTERGKNNPINVMTRMLNEHHRLIELRAIEHKLARY